MITTRTPLPIRILIATFLLCGGIVPSASAKCFQNQPQLPAMPSVAAALPSPGNANARSAESLPARTAGVETAALASSVSIVGLWNLTVTSGGQVVDVGFDAWHSDGTEVLNDYTNPIEGNVCLGVWKQVGPRSYKLTHPSWFFDTTGTLLGTVVIHETVQLSGDGNSYKGFYTYDIYDVSGAFVAELSGELKATRIRPD